MDKKYLLEMRNITKIYPGVVALNEVDFQLEKGQVHALVGANGAGKSTLVNIISGVTKQTKGEVYLNGEKVEIPNEKSAERLGISTVYQERSLAPNMSVANNIYATRQPANALGFISETKLKKKTNELLQKVKLDVDPGLAVNDLSPSKQQLVEIAKALSLEASILILDEPTATITKSETEILFNIIKELKASGIAILYISHRLEEIYEIADIVTIFRDGRRIDTVPINEIEMKDMIHHMVGREVETRQNIVKDTSDCRCVLEADNLSRWPDFKDVCFSLKEGEILGFAGLVGAGRTEVLRAIFGAEPFDSGIVKLYDECVKINHPSDAIKRGIGYLSEDRKEQGLFLEMSIVENLASPNLKNFSTRGWMNDLKIAQAAKESIKQLEIVTPSENQKVLYLSGGNQQKVVLAAWLHTKPRILIVDEPTKGIDVYCKTEIYRILKELQKQGTSIIVVSSEFKELMAFTDRIIVMWEGSVVGEIPTPLATEEKILELSSGLTNEFSIING